MPEKYKMICAQVWNPMCFNKQINSAYTHLIILWDKKNAYIYFQVMWIDSYFPISEKWIFFLKLIKKHW